MYYVQPGISNRELKQVHHEQALQLRYVARISNRELKRVLHRSGVDCRSCVGISNRELKLKPAQLLLGERVEHVHLK